MASLNDIALVARVVTLHDTRAFDRLVKKYQSPVRRFFLHLTCGDEALSDDLAQETFIKAYTGLGGFSGLSNFSTWLYRVTMNTCLDELRRKKNKQTTSLDGLLDAGWSPADNYDTPERHAVNSERRREIRRIITELPEDMRAAVVLRDIQGFSYDEIAVMLDANVGTIKSRISRGREKLREKFQAKPELFDKDDV